MEDDEYLDYPEMQEEMIKDEWERVERENAELENDRETFLNAYERWLEG